MKSACICTRINLTTDGRHMVVREMPESRDDVLWVNLARGKEFKSGGSFIGWAIYLMIFILFSSIITAAQGLFNLSNLQKLFNHGMLLNTSIRVFMEGAIPPAVSGLVFLLVPYVFIWLSKLHFLQYRLDEINLYLKRYADTLIRGGLLVAIFSSSIMSITDFKLEKLWYVLGNVLPHQAVYFITFIITTCFLSLGIEVALITHIAVHFIGLWTQQEPDFAYLYGMNIYMFTICIAFAVISPLTVIFAILYFLVAYFVYTYQLL